MSVIRVKNFRGEVPRQSKLSLGDTHAQIAKNCKLWSGEIRSWLNTRRVNTPSKAGVKKTLYKWGATPDGYAQGNIASINNGSPCQATTDEAHGLTTGARVYMAGTGLGAVDNITHTITVTGSTTFTLNGVNAPGTSVTGTWTKENGFWFHWLNDVDAVHGPIAGDSTERTYFTGDGVPKVTDSSLATSGGTDYPTNSYTLGIPAPVNAPLATLVSGATGGITSISIGVSPPVVETAGAHGLSTDDVVVLSGLIGGGAYPAADTLNGIKYVITVTDATHFSLNGAPALGAYTPDAGDAWTDVFSLTTPLTTSYVYTFVSAWGEEGPPSPPSNLLDVHIGQGVDLSAMDLAPGGNYNIDRKRIYRVATGSTGSDFLLVAEIPIANTTYGDTKLDEQLGEVLPSVDWDPPPSDMAGLISLPNSMLVGFSKNTVCPSALGYPHAYPVSYQRTTEAPVVGLGSFGTTVVVCTQGNPYLLVGVDPQSMSMVKLEYEQACVSKRGIVSIDGVGVVYPSPDGLVLVGSGGVQLVTGLFLTRDEWQALKPESIHAYQLDGRYFAFYDTGTVQGSFMFSFSKAEAGVVLDGGYEKSVGLVFLDAYATAGFSDPMTDALYLQIGDYIERWDAGSTKLTHTWRSKVFRGSRPVNYARGVVRAASYNNLTFKLYADGVLKMTKPITNGDPFVLPSGYRGEEWELEVTGTDDVYEIAVAESIAELAQV